MGAGRRWSTRPRDSAPRYSEAGDCLASWVREALQCAATHRGAWTRSGLRVRATDLEELLSAGYVRAVAQTRDGRPLYEITDAGRSALARTAARRRS